MVKRKSKSRPQAAAEPPPGAPRAMWLALLVIAFVVYVPALWNGFSYDDRVVISDVDYLLSHPSLAPKLLSRDYFALSGEGTYRPTLTLTYMIDRNLGDGVGGAPWVFHLHSVLWHVAAVALVFGTLLRLRAGTLPAGAVALLFAVHPALTEAVDSVAFREDVLSTALGLAALLLFIRARERPGIGPDILAGAFLLLALLAKESAFAFVLLIPITLWCLATPEPSRQSVRAFLRAHRAALTATAAAGFAFLILRFVVFPSGSTYGGYPGGSLWTGAATGVLAIGHYVRLLFVPAPLSADYRGVIAPVTSMVDGRLWMAAAAIGAIVSLAWLARRAAPLVTWGVAVFFIALAPVANLVPIPVPIAERFLYLPYVGGLTALVIGLEHLRRRAGQRLPVWTPLVAVVLAACSLAFLTWSRHDAWKNNESLWSTTLADHPRAYGAMHGLAIVRLDQDRFDEAEALLRRALESPVIDERQRAGMLDDLGTTYGAAGKFEQAVPLFIESLELREGPKAHYNLGIALVGLDRVEEGERHLRRSIELNPYYPNPYPILIELARLRGDAAEVERLERQRPAEN
jgi:Flp pilus assembly protein TadD